MTVSCSIPSRVRPFAKTQQATPALLKLILGRDPTSEEITDARDLDDQTLVQALLGTAEFRYVF